MATIPIFDGTNYKIWSVKMKTLFISMDLRDTVRCDQHGEAAEGCCSSFSHPARRLRPDLSKQAWDILLRFSTQEPTRPDYRNVITFIDLRQTGANHLIVATLIATVAFTAGFTIPGGYNGNDGPNQGMAILTREAAFKAFMVTDTIAMSLSISAVLIHFYAAIPNNQHMLENQVHTAAYLIIYAAVAMVLAFVTGTYAVLAHSSGLAISFCVIGCLPLFFFLITRIIKNVTDQCENNLIGSWNIQLEP